MSYIRFPCSHCGQPFEAPDDMAGERVSCPSCGSDVIVPEPERISAGRTTSSDRRFEKPKFPIVVRASPRALHAVYVKTGFTWALALLVAALLTRFLNHNLTREYGWIVIALWGILGFLLLRSAVRLILARRRILNTTYHIYPNKIEASSYLFRFLGVYNNVANLSQLRQIHATSNSWLDLWFFKCGSVSLTVSGDVADFRLANVYQPGDVRQQIEDIAFGGTTRYRDSDSAPELSDAD